MQSIDMSGKNTGSPNNLSSYKRNNRSNASANFRTHQAEYFHGTPIYDIFSEYPFKDPSIRIKLIQQLNRERALAQKSLMNATLRNKNKKRRSTRRNTRKFRRSNLKMHRGGDNAFKEAALQAMKDNGYSDLENFLKKGGFFTNTGDQEVSLTGNDGVTYTYKVQGHVNIYVYAKKEGIDYQEIGFVSDH